MDKASDFGSEDCAFESHRGRFLFVFIQNTRSSVVKTISNAITECVFCQTSFVMVEMTARTAPTKLDVVRLKPNIHIFRYSTLLFSECGLEQFRCSNGDCVSLSVRCDFRANCVDGSDERDCGM